MGNARYVGDYLFCCYFNQPCHRVVPVGMFDSQEVQYQVDGQTKTRKVVDPHSFRILTNEAGEPEYHRVQLFTTGDERPGLMNFPFEGLTSGSKYGTAVGIIMFMLVIGGAFGIVMRTGTIDNGILALIRHTRGNEILFIPALFILFSLGGAVFGMGEEAVAFAIIIAPLMVRLGYDSITTVLGDLYCHANRFCQFVDEPVLCGRCSGDCRRSGAFWLRVAHRGVGYRHSDWPDLYHGVRLTSEKESSSVTRA